MLLEAWLGQLLLRLVETRKGCDRGLGCEVGEVSRWFGTRMWGFEWLDKHCDVPSSEEVGSIGRLYQ